MYFIGIDLFKIKQPQPAFGTLLLAKEKGWG
jgi:hypothetical protein